MEKDEISNQENDHKPDSFNQIEQNLIESWTKEQTELKEKLKLYDTEQWQLNRYLNKDDSKIDFNCNSCLRYIAGFDISFIKNSNKACSGLVVLDLSDNMNIVYEDIDKEPIEIIQTYVPGFLAYREAPFLLKKLNKLKEISPEHFPQCLVLDGNGLLHINKFGLACHVGVLIDIPTIGVSKKLYQVFGLENNKEHKNRIKNFLVNQGDYFELISNEPIPTVLGVCYKSHSKSTNPIYISIGNKISLNTCVWVVGLVTKKYRIPEPIRQADLRTREHIRKINE